MQFAQPAVWSILNLKCYMFSRVGRWLMVFRERMIL